MYKVYVADVGAGLCSGIFSLCGNDCGYLQLDCGAQKGGERAFRGWKRIMGFYFRSPDTLVLSHHHQDHISGLYYARKVLDCRNSDELFNISRLYCPIIPKVTGADTKKLFLAMKFVNALTFATETGIMELDLIELIRKINKPGHKLNFQALAKGSKFTEGELSFEVLWPPKEIDLADISKSVQEAVNDFDNFLEKYPKLKELYDMCIRNITVENYTQTGEREINCRSDKETSECVTALHKQMDEIKKIFPDIEEVDKSIKKAANHLSLAFFETNQRILFLGDLENKEIETVCDSLENKEIRDFEILIAPHHGTHWNNKLSNLKSKYCISSIGDNLTKYFKEQFYSVSECCLLTFCCGDLIVPWPRCYQKSY